MTYKKFRIGQQLALSFGFIAVLLLVVIFLTYSRITALNANIVLTNSDLYPKTILAHRIKDQVNEAAISMRNALLMNDMDKIEAEFNNIDNGAVVIVAAIKEIDAGTDSGPGRQYVANLLTARERFVAARKHFAELLLQDKKSDAYEQMFGEVLPAQKAYFMAVDGMIAFEQQRMADNVSQSNVQARQTQNLLLVISLSSLLLGALIAWYTTRSITAPLAKT